MKNFFLIGLSVFCLLALGVPVLYFMGGSLVREVVQEVPRGGETHAPRFAVLDAKAPSFELSDLDGVLVKPSDFLGKSVFLIFWTTWNPAGADQLAALDAYGAGDKDVSFSVVAINSQEDRSAVAQFMYRGGYRMRVLLDETGATGDAYGARNLPATYLLDKEGIVRDVRIGTVGKAELEEMVEKILQ